MTSRVDVPERVVGADATRAEHGPLVDRLVPALLRADPLADEAVAALARLGESAHRAVDRALDGHEAPEEVLALIEAASQLPVWTDERRLEKAGELLFRAGVPGGIVLGAKSLLSGYCSPAGNKPLVWSGRLQTNVSRRLAETAKFVTAVAEPGGLQPGAEGFRITLKVRLIHAQVRALIWKQGGWPTARWGAPINQHDMLATVLLFSTAWLEGIEAMGIEVSQAEAEDYVHLWRVAGHILGVEHDLLPATRAEALRLGAIIRQTQAPPDDDSRRLVKAFLDHPVEAAATPEEKRLAARRMKAYAGVMRGLLGEELSDQLELPKDGWRFTVPVVRAVVQRAERARRWIPGGQAFAIEAGRRHWATVVELGLTGLPAEFELPKVLTGSAPPTTVVFP